MPLQKAVQGFIQHLIGYWIGLRVSREDLIAIVVHIEAFGPYANRLGLVSLLVTLEIPAL